MGIKRTLLLFCLSIATQPLAGQSVEYFDEVLARGEQAAQAGNPQAALQIWMEAVDTASAGLTDPRIGRALIETATKDSLTGRYEQAQQAYLWGLQNPAHPAFTDELVEQVAWLEPVSGAVEHRQWQQLLEQGSFAALGSSIRSYWERVDLTLGTAFNEQLIMYWERIGYAREHYRENDNTIYGTDDRGGIYVKYGSPAEVHFGTLDYWSLATLIGNTYFQVVSSFRQAAKEFERELMR